MPKMMNVPDNQVEAMRAIYELTTLVNRHGTEAEGERPPERPTTDHLRALIRQALVDTMTRADTLAQQEGLDKAQEAVAAGASGSDAAAVVKETKAEVWRRLTGHDSGSAWLLNWTQI